MSYATSSQKNAGLGLGIVHALIASGAFLALWFGPRVIAQYGLRSGFLIVALVGVLGVLLSLSAPQTSVALRSDLGITFRRTFKITHLNLLIFILSFAIDGILVVGLAQLLTVHDQGSANLLVLVGSYLMIKRGAMGLMSLMSGFLTRSISMQKLFRYAVLLCILSLTLIAVGYTRSGTLLSFVFNAVLLNLSPLVSIAEGGESDLQSISSCNTWWVVGSAFGTLVGISLLESISSTWIFLALAMLTTLIFTKFNFNGARDRTVL